MIHFPPPPNGSNIEIQNDFNRTTISWKNPSGGISRYGIALFMTVWLGGWTVGEYSVIKQIWEKGIQEFFTPIWLIGWTIGGFFAVLQLFNLLRPRRPEKLVLDVKTLYFQAGTSPFQGGFGKGKENALEKATQFLNFKSKHQIDKSKVEKINLERAGERQRLTLDYGAERIEIGAFLREPEREWVYETLKQWKGNLA